MLFIPMLIALTACGGGEREQATGPVESEEAAPITGSAEDMAAHWVDADRISEELGELPPGSEPEETRTDDGRLIAEGHVCDERPVGKWTYYHENGTVAMTGAYVYGGKRHGPWTINHPDGGAEMQGTYLFGREHGRFTYWHDTGAKKMRGDYREGIRVGPWITWHRNGQRSSQGHYTANRRSGMWQFWDASGTLSGEVYYDADIQKDSEAVNLR